MVKSTQFHHKKKLKFPRLFVYNCNGVYTHVCENCNWLVSALCPSLHSQHFANFAMCVCAAQSRQYTSFRFTRTLEKGVVDKTCALFDERRERIERENSFRLGLACLSPSRRRRPPFRESCIPSSIWRQLTQVRHL